MFGANSSEGSCGILRRSMISLTYHTHPGNSRDQPSVICFSWIVKCSRFLSWLLGNGRAVARRLEVYIAMADGRSFCIVLTWLGEVGLWIEQNMEAPSYKSIALYFLPMVSVFSRPGPAASSTQGVFCASILAVV